MAVKSFLSHIRLQAVINLPLNHIRFVIALHHHIPIPSLVAHTILPSPLLACHLQNTIDPSATHHLG
jgi:hypothetical protein